MKKLLFTSAMMALAITAMAQTDLYLTGSNINGTSWSPNAENAKLTYADGVYTWDGTELGQEFKFTNGTWGTQWSAPDDTRCVPGENYTIVAGEVKNIFLSVPKLTNPHVEVNLETLTIKVTGQTGEEEIYVIGDNVNGNSWKLLSPDAKMTPKGNGVYEWDGTLLSTGFKFNNGSWSDDSRNFGAPANAPALQLGTPYTIVAAGNSDNIKFADIASVENPHVVLDINNFTVTVTGSGSGSIKWYIAGINNNWNLNDDTELTETSDGVYEKSSLEITQTGTMKITSSGWATQFGTYGDTAVSDGSLSVVLEEVSGDGGNLPYSITGSYDVKWESATNTLTFTSLSTGVANLEAAQQTASFYNLQGVRVATPVSGQLYIVVRSGVASKVVF